MTNDLACRDVVELLTAYLEGALDAAIEHEVRDHLAICEGCERYLEQLQETITELGRSKADQGMPLSVDSVKKLTAAFRATFPQGESSHSN